MPMQGATSVAGIVEIAGLTTVPANQFVAGPTSGANAPATLRALVDADIPAAIARDSEVTSAVSSAISTHEAAVDPHPQYTTAAEAGTIADASAAAAAASAVATHVVALDPHTQYQRESEKDGNNGYLGADGSARLTSTRLSMSATNTLVGRSTAGAGASEEITCTAAARALLDDADAATMRATLSAQKSATTGSVSASNATATTLFTVPNTAGLYLIYVWVSGQGAAYCATVRLVQSGAGGATPFMGTPEVGSGSISITLVGSDVKATQSSGGTATINYGYVLL